VVCVAFCGCFFHNFGGILSDGGGVWWFSLEGGKGFPAGAWTVRGGHETHSQGAVRTTRDRSGFAGLGGKSCFSCVWGNPCIFRLFTEGWGTPS